MLHTCATMLQLHMCCRGCDVSAHPSVVPSGYMTAGVVGMCKEHLGVALALKVPVFFLVCRFHPAVLLFAS